jgi:hypothetical protein
MAQRETLLQKQFRFMRMKAQLYAFAWKNGYEITQGDGYRAELVFGKMGERKGYGESYSQHKVRLAEDINLFKNGRWLKDTSDHLPLGQFWESIGGSWGGRFGDGNHYSLEHDGHK